MKRRMTAVVALLALGSLTACRAEDAAVPIEGDVSLVKGMLEKLDSNRKRAATKGRVIADTTFKIFDVAMKKPRQVYTAHVQLLWEGENRHWSIDQKRDDGNDSYQTEAVHTPAKRFFHYPQSKGLVTVENKSVGIGIREFAEIHPDDAWFVCWPQLSHRLAVDPAHLPNVLTKYEIHKDGESRIVVRKHYKIGGYYEFVVSNAHGGNIVSYDTVQEEGQGRWMRGRLEWAELPGPTWYVKSCRHESSVAGTPQKIDTEFSMEVTDFEPLPKIEPGRFSLGALRVAPGTRVREYGPTGTVDRQYRTE